MKHLSIFQKLVPGSPGPQSKKSFSAYFSTEDTHEPNLAKLLSKTKQVVRTCKYLMVF